MKLFRATYKVQFLGGYELRSYYINAASLEAAKKAARNAIKVEEVRRSQKKSEEVN